MQKVVFGYEYTPVTSQIGQWRISCDQEFCYRNGDNGNRQNVMDKLIIS